MNNLVFEMTGYHSELNVPFSHSIQNLVQTGLVKAEEAQKVLPFEKPRTP